jgi:hypothetical protein
MQLTIANTETESSSIKPLGRPPMGLIVPASFEGTTLTFEVSQDDVSFIPFTKEDGSDYAVTVAASTAVMLLPDFARTLGKFYAFRVVSNNAVAAERVIEAIMS